MATSLDVVNDCLAIMGEAPLNALAESHAFKQAALSVLTRNDRAIQAKGWWYNSEDLVLRVNPADHRVYLPSDGATIKPQPFQQVRGSNGAILNPSTARGRYVQRGRVLYDLQDGTDRFPDGFQYAVKLIRQVPFEDTPVSINSYISRKTVLDFQMEYDGDQTKTRNLQAEVLGVSGVSLGLKGEAEAEDIRAVGYNFINESERLSRVRNTINYSRRPR